MWSKVNELSANGLKDWQICLLTGLHRDTVRKYRQMSKEEFEKLLYRPYHNRVKKLSCYTPAVEKWLKESPYLTSPQILDRLKETFDDLPEVSDKTVYNFVEALRQTLKIPKGKEEVRQMIKLPDPAYGYEAQVDWGEKYMITENGHWKKVYFFAMVMSRSRYKFVYFQDIPFTSKMTVYAHHLAFQYFGGMPKRVVYDQDAVLIVAENNGDYILTEEMEAFRKSAGYTAVFCRPKDPQSKGKIENVVGFVKNHFIKGRKFTTIEALNEQALGWLERTGNGHRHAGTRLIPAEEFKKERPELMPYTVHVARPVTEGRAYTVRRDNTISYKGCFYQMPKGTYQGDDSKVRVVETSPTEIEFFDTGTGKPIISYTVCAIKGRTVTRPELSRIDNKGCEKQERALLELYGEHAALQSKIRGYMSQIKDDRPRYYNDSVKSLLELMKQLALPMAEKLIDLLLKNHVMNVYDAYDIANAMLVREGLPELTKYHNRFGNRGRGAAPSANLNPSKTNIADYDALINQLSENKTAAVS